MTPKDRHGDPAGVLETLDLLRATLGGNAPGQLFEALMARLERQEDRV